MGAQSGVCGRHYAAAAADPHNVKGMRMNKLLLMTAATAASLSLLTPAMAQVVNAKGVGTITYSGTLGAGERDRAYRLAQMASVERYFAEHGEAEAENSDAIAPAVSAALDKFLLGTTVLNEQDQPGLKKYSVVVRTELNVAKLRTAVRTASGAAKAPGAAKTPMAYLFVARETGSIKAFDDRVVQREDVSNETRIDASAVGKGARNGRGGSINATMRISDSTIVETGGSSTRKNDERGYRMLAMAAHKTAVTSVFSQSGFAGTDAELILNDNDMKAVTGDFSRGVDLGAATLRAIIASLRAAQVPLLVIATFDVGMPDIDPVTGLRRAGVSVSGRVMDLSGPQPREIAAVPPVTTYGLAPDNAGAAGKALSEAAMAAAREIVGRLNAAGVK